MFSLITQAVPVAIIISFLSLIYCIFLITQVLRHPRGDKKMNAISDAIQTGANAYMKRQYTVISIVGLIIFILLFFGLGKLTAIGFAVGAIFSAVAGITGMALAVRSNIRTAQAAKSGLAKAFNIAFAGGSVTGLMVAGLALLAIWFLLFYYFV